MITAFTPVNCWKAAIRLPISTTLPFFPLNSSLIETFSFFFLEFKVVFISDKSFFIKSSSLIDRKFNFSLRKLTIISVVRIDLTEKRTGNHHILSRSGKDGRDDGTRGTTITSTTTTPRTLGDGSRTISIYYRLMNSRIEIRRARAPITLRSLALWKRANSMPNRALTQLPIYVCMAKYSRPCIGIDEVSLR